MNTKKNIFFSSFKILDKKLKLLFVLVAISSILISFIELVGIGLLGTFILFLTDISESMKQISNFKFFSFLLTWDRMEIIYFFLYSILIFFLIKNIIVFMYLYFFNKFRIFFNYQISEKVFLKIIKSNYEYFLSQKKSKIIHDIKIETERFTGLFFSILSLTKEIFLVIFLLGGIFLINWKISSIVFALFIFVSLIIFSFIKKKLYLLGKDLTFFTSQFLKKLIENLNNIKFIKIRNLEDYITSKIYFYQKKIFETSFYQSVLVIIPRLLLEVISVMALCLVIFLYINTSEPIEKLLPTLSFISLAIVRMLPSISSINTNINNITSHVHSLEIIVNYLKDENTLHQKKINDEIIIKKNKITNLKFNGVSFKYKVKDTLFEMKNINLELNKNDVLGVVGSSGSGKTTFADLVLGLLKPDNGKILLNDTNLENLDYNDFNISYIPQSVILIDENLYKNISLGFSMENLDMKKMNDALTKADLDNFDKDFYQRKIGEDGMEISGGQKQRIGIARAFYGEPNLLILDEPTSELDYKSEEKIMSNLISTEIDIIIIIAHRINTLNICNKLLILNDGNVVDFDTKENIIIKHPDLKKYFTPKN